MFKEFFFTIDGHRIWELKWIVNNKLCAWCITFWFSIEWNQFPNIGTKQNPITQMRNWKGIVDNALDSCVKWYQWLNGHQKDLFKCENVKFILFVLRNFSFVWKFSITWTQIEIKTYDLALRKCSYVFRAKNEFWSSFLTFHIPCPIPFSCLKFICKMRIVPTIRKCVFVDYYCSLHFVCHRSGSLIRSKVKDVLIETYCIIPVIYLCICMMCI